MDKNSVIIIGGGIAGLSCASELFAQGYQPIVIDKESQLGGNVKTAEVDGFQLELGPNSFMGAATDIFTLIERHGLNNELLPSSPKANYRYIVRGNKLHPLPFSPLSFITSRAISLKSKLYLMSEPFRISRGASHESAYQFFVRRFGEEATQVMIGAFVSGVYAGNLKKLSAPAAFPLFWSFEQRAGSMIRGAILHQKDKKKSGVKTRPGLYSLKNGLGNLTQKIEKDLGKGLVRTNEPVLSIRHDNDTHIWHINTSKESYQTQSVVIALPPDAAAPLFSPFDSILSEELSAISMAKVAVVYIAYPLQGNSHIPDGFGFLASREENILSLGVLFSSCLFNNRAPEGYALLTAFVGGVFSPELTDLRDHELFQLVMRDLETLKIAPEKSSLIQVIRHKSAIPQLNLGHLDRIKRIDLRSQNYPGLYLAGNYLRGVGIKDAVISGRDAAKKIFAHSSPSHSKTCSE